MQDIPVNEVECETSWLGHFELDPVWYVLEEGGSTELECSGKKTSCGSWRRCNGYSRCLYTFRRGLPQWSARSRSGGGLGDERPCHAGVPPTREVHAI